MPDAVLTTPMPSPDDPHAAAPAARPVTAELPAPDPLLPLALAARAGDRAATRELLATLAPTALRIASSVLGRDHAEVDDAVQQALIGFVRSLPGFRGECRVAHFMARIATRAAMAQRRRRARRNETPLPEHDEPSAHDDDGAGATAGPHGAALSERCCAAWRALLAELPEAQAETILLRVVLEYSLDETADATGVPVNTVRSRIRLARAALQRRVTEGPALAELLLEEDAP